MPACVMLVGAGAKRAGRDGERREQALRDELEARPAGCAAHDFAEQHRFGVLVAEDGPRSEQRRRRVQVSDEVVPAIDARGVVQDVRAAIAARVRKQMSDAHAAAVRIRQK